MRLQLNSPDVRLWDANKYTEKYLKDRHFLCDDTMRGPGTPRPKKEKPSEAFKDDFEISPYSTIF